MLAYWLHQIAAHFYQVWAVVGPLVGVVIGAWLTARWQRKKRILDNKTSEYRGILDALNSYRFVLTEYYALYKVRDGGGTCAKDVRRPDCLSKGTRSGEQRFR